MVTMDNYLELPAYTREVRAAVGRRRLKVGNQRLPGRMDGLWPVMQNSPPRVVVYPSMPQKVKAYWCQDSEFFTSCSLGNWEGKSPWGTEGSLDSQFSVWNLLDHPLPVLEPVIYLSIPQIINFKNWQKTPYCHQVIWVSVRHWMGSPLVNKVLHPRFGVCSCSLELLLGCHPSTFSFKEKTILPKQNSVKLTLLIDLSKPGFCRLSIVH